MMGRDMMSTSICAMVLASTLMTQYVNKYRYITSMAVTIAVYQFDWSSNGALSISKASYGPIASLDVLIIDRVSNLLSVCFFCMHFIHLLLCLVILSARPGK